MKKNVNFYELLNIDPSTRLERVKEALANAVVFLDNDNIEFDSGMKLNNPEQARFIYKKATEAFLNEKNRMKYDFLGINGEFDADEDFLRDLEVMKRLNIDFLVNYSINKGFFDSKSDNVNIFFIFLKSIAALIFLVYLVPDYAWIIFFVTIAHLAIKIVFYMNVGAHSRFYYSNNIELNRINVGRDYSPGENKLIRFYQKFYRCDGRIAFVRIFKMAIWFNCFILLMRSKHGLWSIRDGVYLSSTVFLLVVLYVMEMRMERELYG